MKKLITTIALLMSLSVVIAQTFGHVDVNNVKARVNSGGDLFWNLVGSPGFEAPKGSGIHTVFGANLWIAGVDQNNQLHVAAQTYRQNGVDFWPGPLDTVNVNIQPAVSTQWNTIWKINKTTIDSFNLGLFSPSIPPAIANWPGNGDANYNQAQLLAPFFDVNNDGTYNPSQGDYPQIQGDQAIYFIINDNQSGSVHGETGGVPLGVEIHGMAYAFNCPTDSALNQTVFLHYTIINRSANTYNNTYVGIWTDFDIGNYDDDLIGCDVKRQCYYGYNGDNDDGGGAPGTYGIQLGAQAVVFLNGVVADVFDAIDNDKDCIIDEPNETNLMSKFIHYENNWTTVGGNPTDSLDYYQYLQGLWKNDSSITYGGYGYNTGAPCNYMNPGNSDHQYEWGTGGNCQTTGAPQLDWYSPNVPSDMRGMGSSGRFTMLPNTVYSFDLAYVFARDYSASGSLASVNLLMTRVDSIRSYFNGNMTPCGSIFNTSVSETPKPNNTISVYPNPANENLFVSFEMQSKNASVQIYDVTGNLVKELEITNGNSQINISQLAQGLYVIKIVDGNKLYSKKFLKE